MDDGTFERLRAALLQAYGKAFVESLSQALQGRYDSPEGQKVLVVVSLDPSVYEALRRDAELVTVMAGATSHGPVSKATVATLLEDLADYHLDKGKL